MLKVKKIKSHAILPQKAHDGDLGYDLFSAEEKTVYPNEIVLVSAGISIGFPSGYGGFIKDRSSVSTKQGMFTVAGVIDNGYTGEIKVALHNASDNVWKCSVGDKIAQLVLIPTVNFAVSEVEELTSIDGRGDNGFGSTGN